MLSAIKSARRPSARIYVFYFAALAVITFGGFAFFGLPLLTKEADPVKIQPRLGDCSLASYKFAEIKLHSKCSLRDLDANDFWMIVNGNVYDVTSWSAFGFLHYLISDVALTDPPRQLSAILVER